MSISSRLAKLEAKQPKAAPVIRVVIYDKETGRAMAGSSPEIIGKTREEISAMDGPGTVTINVRPASEVTNFYIPDNGRGDL